jgi:hypothetical protein
MKWRIDLATRLWSQIFCIDNNCPAIFKCTKKYTCPRRERRREIRTDCVRKRCQVWQKQSSVMYNHFYRAQVFYNTQLLKTWYTGLLLEWKNSFQRQQSHIGPYLPFSLFLCTHCVPTAKSLFTEHIETLTRPSFLLPWHSKIKFDWT